MYAFVTAGNTLTIVVNCRPFSEPGNGAMYERFADDALYSINIANPITGALLMTYDFQFSPVSSAAGDYKNKQTISPTGAEQRSEPSLLSEVRSRTTRRRTQSRP